jgi:hypothetical protein
MSRVERKYDFFETPRFRRALKKSSLNEFEAEIVVSSILYFCTSLDKSIYNPIEIEGGVVFYEFDIPIMSRNFRIVFEVDGIDAYALDFQEV